MRLIVLSIFLSSIIFAKDIKPIEDFFNGDYQTYRNHKSIAAIYHKKEKKWLIGFSYQAANKAIAKRTAIKKCKEYAKEEKLKGNCKTYALDKRKLF